MDSIFGSYPILYQSVPCGTLQVIPQGLSALFRASCRPGNGGVMRLVCQCGEKQIRIGVLAPNPGGSFGLRRSISLSSLRLSGLHAIDSCHLIPAEESVLSHQWQPCPDPAALFTGDRFIAHCADKTQGVLVRHDSSHILLAFPVTPGQPFSMLPAACMSVPREISGRSYLVFKVKNGKLT